MRSHNSNKGFSLIELLIVVTVIGIIAAIAVPNLLSAKRAANEASALSTMRIIVSGEYTYRATAGGGNYGDFTSLRDVNLVDARVGAATIAGPGTPKSGFLYAAAPVNGIGIPAFDAQAQPSLHTSASSLFGTGTRSFYVNETGKIYFNTTDTAPTGAADSTRAVLDGTLLN